MMRRFILIVFVALCAQLVAIVAVPGLGEWGVKVLTFVYGPFLTAFTSFMALFLGGADGVIGLVFMGGILVGVVAYSIMVGLVVVFWGKYCHVRQRNQV